jgi:hypothetical protein
VPVGFFIFCPTARLNGSTAVPQTAPRWQSLVRRSGLQSRPTPVQIRPLAVLLTPDSGDGPWRHTSSEYLRTQPRETICQFPSFLGDGQGQPGRSIRLDALATASNASGSTRRASIRAWKQSRTVRPRFGAQSAGFSCGSWVRGRSETPREAGTTGEPSRKRTGIGASPDPASVGSSTCSRGRLRGGQKVIISYSSSTSERMLG